MSIKIGSNIASIQAQRRLGEATSSLTSIYERLSSGQRINKASDDAANLSVMLSTDAQIKIANQAKRNLNDGISLAQIADSAIEQLSNITNRLSELATQAANGAYSSTQRRALNSEAQTLIAEYSRIVDSTKYNGRSILAQGSSTVIQGGEGTQNTLTINTGVGSGADVTEAVGTGQYSSSSTVTGLAGLSDFLAGDLNGDGYSDLVYIDGPLSVRLSNGSGGYNAAQNYSTGGSGTTFGDVVDVDGDGDLDIITSNVNSDNFGILLNNGSGVFAAPVSYNNSNGIQELAIGDFNEDGNLDVAGASSLAGSFSINFGNGDGTFNSEVTGYTQGGRSRSVKTADLDGDGHLDLVFGRNDSNEINVFFGTGTGTFGSQLTISITGNDPEIELADINGDSKIDIVVGTASELSILTNQGSRAFTKTNSTALTDIGGIDTADYDGDGKYDVLVGGDSSNAAYIYKGNSNGTLSLTSTLTNGVNDVDFVSFGSVNTDGVLDVFIYSQQNTLTSTFTGASEVVTHSVNVLNSVDISTRTGALSALDGLQSLKDSLIAKRGELGASLSRANTFLSQVSSNALALTEAKSRITDIDVASETAKLVAAQVLQQAATAILAQTSKSQNINLSLLINV